MNFDGWNTKRYILVFVFDVVYKIFVFVFVFVFVFDAVYKEVVAGGQ